MSPGEAAKAAGTDNAPETGHQTNRPGICHSIKRMMQMVKKYTDYIEYINSTLQVPANPTYTAIDLFAGCGGLSLGFEAAGIKTIGYEMSDDCCITYRQNLKSECHKMIITEQTEFPKVRLLIGGPPCQPFSRRGKQKGGNDHRNGFPAFIEAVRKIKPDIWLCENVKGLPEQNTDYFQSILDAFKKLGYIVEYRTFKLVRYDVPQNRERMVIIGHHGGFKFPDSNDYTVTAGEALGSLAGEIPSDAVFLTPAMDEYIAKYEAASKCKTPRDLHLDRPARTLTCRNLAGATSDMHRIKLPDGRRRRITVREAARLQGFPDWFLFSGTEESQFTQIGNAVPPIFAYKMALAVLDYLEGRYKRGMDRYNLPEIETRKSKDKKAFQEKSNEVQLLIRQSLFIIDQLGIPLEGLTGRMKEKIAMALLAAGGVKSPKDWHKIQSANTNYSVTTKQCIDFYNTYLEENMSKGSYDYVLRDGLKKLLIGQIVEQSKPESNISDATRGYRVSAEYARIISKFGQNDWEKQVEIFNKTHKTYMDRITQKRNLPKIAVKLADGTEFQLTDGEHNLIQQQVLTEFLPRYGYGAEVLYCGDSDNKYGVVFEKEKLKEFGIQDLSQGKLPDIVAYSREKDWLYLIEAYHTSNPMTVERKYELGRIFSSVADKCIYITAFENNEAYHSCTQELAWETEVWIVTDPDHIMHRNGTRFMGPYEKSE